MYVWIGKRKEPKKVRFDLSSRKMLNGKVLFVNGKEAIVITEKDISVHEAYLYDNFEEALEKERKKREDELLLEMLKHA